ncbi:ricin-type beta-trefoil lectin domain protein [Kitasatospora sp. NPDC004240]
MLDAIGRAKASGKPVVVENLTTETSRTIANPSGTLTTTDNAQAVRTRRGGAWADIDSSLRANADGTLSPAVASTSLSFSGGGSGPMATVATEDGRKLSIGAPFVLPKPTLNGATATYAGVLPGVDLQLTALPVGGWRDVIIVRTAEAAANPALKALRFPITAQGLTVTSDAGGHIDVKDDVGKLRFRSPAPLQWDSSTQAASQPVPLAKQSRSAVAAADAPVNSGMPSSAEEPGDGANVVAIGTKVSGGAIELTPDRTALGSGTGPWYLDPSLTAATSTTEGSVEVQENHKSAENYNKKTELATGYCGYRSSDPSLDCSTFGRQRAYFRFGINPAIHTVPANAQSAPTIFSATLNAQVTRASSPGTSTPFVVYSAPAGKTIHEHSNWYDQPCEKKEDVVMQGCAPVNGQPLTGTGPLAIDVTDAMKRAAAEKWPTWTVGIAPQASELERLFRHHLASNPSITTTYDVNPTIWYPRTSPIPGFASNNGLAECTSGGATPWDNPGWVGNNQNIYLAANSLSPTGQSLYTSYQMWDDNDPNFRFSHSEWAGSYNNPGSPVSVGALSDGHQYGWLAQASDGILTSPVSAWCYFRVDRTNPRVSIDSSDFPASGTLNDKPTKFAGQTGTFTVNGQDPTPGAGLQASGVACIRVSADPTPIVGWRCDATTLAPGQTFTYQPRNWGTNTVYAWAMDNAGNYSQPAVYNFYAPWKPGTLPVFGDLDNDQKADIAVADSRGDLRVIGGATDPGNSLAAPAAAAPGRDAAHSPVWSDYQLTHRATLRDGLAVDQLIAHNTKDAELKKYLYLVKGNGEGRFDTLTSSRIDRPRTCKVLGTGTTCVDYAADWAAANQVVAIGSPDNETLSLDPDADPVRTYVLTVEGETGKLYYMAPGGIDQLLAPAWQITVSDGGNWNDYEILNPGAANGVTRTPNLPDAKQATIWAREKATGNILAYPITRGADGKADFTSLTKPKSGVVILAGAGLTSATHPQIGAADLNSDGFADLWVIDGTKAIAIFPGTSSDGTAGKVDGFGPYIVAGFADASVSIRSDFAGGACVDAWSGLQEGGELAVYSCWAGPNQQFNFATDGTLRVGSFCVSTQGDVLDNGAAVVLARCDRTKKSQRWTMRPDGRIVITETIDKTGPGTAKCLELPGWNTAPGTRLGIWDCVGTNANQGWRLQSGRTP